MSGSGLGSTLPVQFQGGGMEFLEESEAQGLVARNQHPAVVPAAKVVPQNEATAEYNRTDGSSYFTGTGGRVSAPPRMTHFETTGTSKLLSTGELGGVALTFPALFNTDKFRSTPGSGKTTLLWPEQHLKEMPPVNRRANHVSNRSGSSPAATLKPHGRSAVERSKSHPEMGFKKSKGATQDNKPGIPSSLHQNVRKSEKQLLAEMEKLEAHVKELNDTIKQNNLNLHDKDTALESLEAQIEYLYSEIDKGERKRLKLVQKLADMEHLKSDLHQQIEELEKMGEREGDVREPNRLGVITRELGDDESDKGDGLKDDDSDISSDAEHMKPFAEALQSELDASILDTVPEETLQAFTAVGQNILNAVSKAYRQKIRANKQMIQDREKIIQDLKFTTLSMSQLPNQLLGGDHMNFNDHLEHTRNLTGAITAHAEEAIHMDNPGPEYDVCLVFIQIEGVASLREANAEVTQKSLDVFHKLASSFAEVRNGYSIQKTDDSFFVAFSYVLDAILFASELQLQLLAQEWPPSLHGLTSHAEVGTDLEGHVIWKGLRAKCALHIDPEPESYRDPVSAGYMYYGTCMKRGYRMLEACHGGEILCSTEFLEKIQEDTQLTQPPARILHSFSHNLTCNIIPAIAFDVHQLIPPELEGRIPELQYKRQEIQVPATGKRYFEDLGTPQGSIAIVFAKIEGMRDNHGNFCQTDSYVLEAIDMTMVLVEEERKEFQGYQAQQAKDHVLLVFPHAMQALMWAVRMQDRLNKAAWPQKIVYSNQDAYKLSVYQKSTIFRGLRMAIGITFAHKAQPIKNTFLDKMLYYDPHNALAVAYGNVASGGEILMSETFYEEASGHPLFGPLANKHFVINEGPKKVIFLETGEMTVYQCFPKSLLKREPYLRERSQRMLVQQQIKLQEEFEAREAASKKNKTSHHTDINQGLQKAGLAIANRFVSNDDVPHPDKGVVHGKNFMALGGLVSECQFLNHFLNIFRKSQEKHSKKRNKTEPKAATMASIRLLETARMASLDTNRDDRNEAVRRYQEDLYHHTLHDDEEEEVEDLVSVRSGFSDGLPQRTKSALGSSMMKPKSSKSLNAMKKGDTDLRANVIRQHACVMTFADQIKTYLSPEAPVNEDEWIVKWITAVRAIEQSPVFKKKKALEYFHQSISFAVEDEEELAGVDSTRVGKSLFAHLNKVFLAIKPLVDQRSRKKSKQQFNQLQVDTNLPHDEPPDTGSP